VNILYHHRTRARDVEGVHIRGMIQGLRHLGHEVDVVGRSAFLPIFRPRPELAR